MMAKSEKKTESLSNREIILQELEKIPGPKKIGSNGWINIICPFHDDNSPSCGIKTTGENVGGYNCFSCDAKGPWGKLADKLGLAHIKGWNKSESMDESLADKETDAKLLGDTGITFKQVMKTFGTPEATLWPENIEWRGFPGTFMRKIGAHVFHDKYAQTLGALFPVKVGGRVRGGVKAAFEKKKGSLSYVTMRGDWAQDYGLFPYVYARQLIRRKKLNFVVMVEGPRDAMRLCLNGIPAVAVLGAKNVTKKKMLFISALGIDTVYCMPDRDDGGKLFWKLVKKCSRERELPAKRILLPDKKIMEDGKKTKMDPGNAPKKVMRKILEYFHETHGLEMPDNIQ
jgi:hypothetical protein